MDTRHTHLTVFHSMDCLLYGNPPSAKTPLPWRAFRVHTPDTLRQWNPLRTLSKAAEELHMSQPTLTRAMQKLESEFDVPLFRRSRNRLEFNETGKLAADYAGKILDQTQDMLSLPRCPLTSDRQKKPESHWRHIFLSPIRSLLIPAKFPLSLLTLWKMPSNPAVPSQRNNESLFADVFISQNSCLKFPIPAAMTLFFQKTASFTYRLLICRI